MVELSERSEGRAEAGMSVVMLIRTIDVVDERAWTHQVGSQRVWAGFALAGSDSFIAARWLSPELGLL